ncbi:MAG: thioredoxin domain-containing protein [Patescibacteria group bacterium]
MKSFKKIVIAGMLAFVLLGSTVQPVAAAAPDFSSLSPEARATLLTTLLKQLVYLQEQLALITANEKANIELEEPSPVTAADYTKGAADAKIKLITYTDFDCPFCKSFHSTLNTIVNRYPDVSITYRHYPLEQLFPNSKKLSIAAECAGRVGGDAAFYQFTDSVFNLRGLNDRTDMSKLSTYAQSAGVQAALFEACRNSNEAELAVLADIKEGTALSVTGAPQSYFFKNGEMGKMQGAQPLIVVEQIIENLLK